MGFQKIHSLSFLFLLIATLTSMPVNPIFADGDLDGDGVDDSIDVFDVVTSYNITGDTIVQSNFIIPVPANCTTTGITTTTLFSEFKLGCDIGFVQNFTFIIRI